MARFFSHFSWNKFYFNAENRKVKEELRVNGRMCASERRFLCIGSFFLQLFIAMVNLFHCQLDNTASPKWLWIFLLFFADEFVFFSLFCWAATWRLFRNPDYDVANLHKNQNIVAQHLESQHLCLFQINLWYFFDAHTEQMIVALIFGPKPNRKKNVLAPSFADFYTRIRNTLNEIKFPFSIGSIKIHFVCALFFAIRPKWWYVCVYYFHLAPRTSKGWKKCTGICNNVHIYFSIIPFTFHLPLILIAHIFLIIHMVTLIWW